MANFKLSISDPSTRKAYKKEVDQNQSGLLGKKIREKVSGSGIGLAGYELEITGGSDKEGFPMRPDVDGPARKRILLSSPPGYHPERKGKRKRKSIRGNVVSEDTSQVNVKVVKAGPKKLEELLGTKKEEKAEAKAEKLAEAGEKHAEAKEAKEVKHEAKAEKKHDTPEARHEAKSGQDQAEKAEAKMGVKKLE